MKRIIIAGEDVAAARQARKVAALGNGPLYSSEALCAWQRSEARYGIEEAEIVQSLYGYSVRYASGLQNFAILASAQRKDIDGSYEAALEWATAWQKRAADRRFVSISNRE